MFAWQYNPRKVLIVLHDLTVTVVALIAAFYIRFDEEGLVDRVSILALFLPPFVLYAGLVYYFFGLYESKWRFASLPDLFNIFRATLITATTLVIFDYIIIADWAYGNFFFGKKTIFLYWCLQMLALGGPRLAYRYYRYHLTARHNAAIRGSIPTLILGRAMDAEMVIRAIESGALTKVWPLGILSPSPADQGTTVRNVRVLGDLKRLKLVAADFEQRGTRIRQAIISPSALDPENEPEQAVRHAREVGISVLHLPGLEGAHSPGRVRLSKLDVEDLLLRPTVQIDFSRLEQFARGTSVVVTGGGGSIGAEICRRVAAFGAARLLIIENSELALKNVLDALARDGHAMEIHGRIADVRDRPRMLRLIGEFKPDLVFHAAALKHVPVVEQEWAEGIKTNVFGSVNVADAAIAAGARAMVMISTDKAIEPVSVLGATKRLAEMYCQALDASLAARTTQVVSMVRSPHPTRLISVRFGNVLASNGSVVPKFQEQIEAGGPVTVTDPDMMRYFMTIREACDLVITSASHATSEGTVDASVYVLNMGKQVKIVELAERMIELAGYEPGKDIDIVFTGLRPGERKQEILFARGEPVCDIGIAGIVAAKPSVPSMDDLDHCLAALKEGIARDDRATIFTVFERIVPEYRGAAA